MKEEIEEEFYPGEYEEIQKGKLYRKTALLIPEGERERLGKFIVSFFSVVRFVTYVGEEAERERNWGKWFMLIRNTFFLY